MNKPTDTPQPPQSPQPPRAEAITLIFTNLTVVGEGRGEHDPVRRVEEFWTEDGRLVARNDPFDYSLFFRQSIEAAHRGYQDIITNILGVQLSEENPGALVTGLVDTAIELKQDVEMLLKDKGYLEQENIALREEIAELREHLNPTRMEGPEADPEPSSDSTLALPDEHVQIIFALSKGDGKDEVIASFRSDGDAATHDRLWGVILKLLEDAKAQGANPDPERFQLPEDFHTGGYTRVYGYLGHFLNDELDRVSPFLYQKQL